jgi:hypothetical protein
MTPRQQQQRHSPSRAPLHPRLPSLRPVKTLTRRYFDMIRVDIIASGISGRDGTQPHAVHAPMLLFAAGIAL